MAFASRLAVMAICVCYALGNVFISVTAWEVPDIEAYWGAALRLREGGPLYVPATNVNASDVYRYAPWFAFLWIPLTYLPRDLVNVGWSVALLAGSLGVMLPPLLTGNRAAVAFTAIIGSFIILIASRGNVQPLMVVALVFGVERRSGPVWIAACASLKAIPILFALVYAIRGEWRRFWETIALTAFLVVPMLLFGIDDYTTDPGRSQSLYFISPVLFAVVAVASVVAAVYLARRYHVFAWLAVSVAAVLCLPRYFPYELSFLFVGLVPVVEAWRRNGTPAGKPA